jgi:hypothetical protein
MSEVDIGRQPNESVADYAQRMQTVVRNIAGRVSIDAGRYVDFDDVLEELDYIISQKNDDRAMIWSLQRKIGKVVDRMSDVSRLRRILVYVTELNR